MIHSKISCSTSAGFKISIIINFMDSILETYRDSWEQLIKPDDSKYHISELEPVELELEDNHRITREDFTIFNTKGKKMECSLYRHSRHDSHLVIYSHGHSGNRAEGAYLVDAVCPHFSLMVFDYTGYGYSDTDHCTLGLKEADDLECIVEHARHVLKFKYVFVWGRSMGAVTALLLAHRSRGSLLHGLLLDSPFSSTKEMLCNVLDKVPNFLLHLVFSPLGAKLRSETGHDVLGIDLKPLLPEVRVPALFAIAHHDKLAGVADLEQLYLRYGSAHAHVHKRLFKFEGEHASKRPDQFFQEGVAFFLAVQEELKHMPAIQTTNPHFEARKEIAALHSRDSPNRFKKIRINPEGDDSNTSMAELSTDGQPFRVRATPSDISLLAAVRGDHVDNLSDSPVMETVQWGDIEAREEEAGGAGYSHSRFANLHG